ncbi:MAG: hypothetical protein LBT27_07830 [Prevotellaceae bacterium]|jgi:hypothetical protein|nr:hypothetical protein [Prevotellaceae bacterium]
MKTKILKLAAILLLAGVVSCGENNCVCDTDTDTERWVETEAIIVDLGDPSVDGCGWAVLINNVINVPEFIDEQYKQHELKVEIVYKKTSQVHQCVGFSEMKYNKVIIKQIKTI